MRTLALDLGTNSIGSALIEWNSTQKESLKNIIHMGSRIIPMGDEKTQFEQGQTITKNAERRLSRGSRRNNQRYLLRRGNLIKALKKLTALPEEYSPGQKGLDQVLFGKSLTDEEIYALRAKAVRNKVSLHEFGRLLYQLNQRRGYKPNRKERSLKDKEKESNYEEFNRTLKVVSAVPTGEIKKGRTEYLVTLSDATQGTTENPAFASMAGNEREYEILIRKRTLKDESVNITFGLPVISDWQKRVDLMEFELFNSGLTPGQYYHRKIVDFRANGMDYRIRENLIMRYQYIQEFNRIWDEQAKHHTILSNKEVLNDIIEDVMPVNTPEKAVWKKKSLKEFIRDYIIYYQRPLKSQKRSIGNCRFEPLKKVMPVSHPLYQEFRIWQSINNIKIHDENGNVLFLDENQKVKLYEKLCECDSLSKDQVAKFFKLNPELVHMPESIPGNETRVALKRAFKKAALNLGDLNDKQYELLWHILYSLEEHEDVENALMNKFGYTADQAEIIGNIYFDKNWGSLSARAVKKLLPLMKTGKYYSIEDIQPQETKLIESIINGEVNPIHNDNVRINCVYRTNLHDFNGLPYWLASSIIYGSHTVMSDA